MVCPLPARRFLDSGISSPGSCRIPGGVLLNSFFRRLIYLEQDEDVAEPGLSGIDEFQSC